MKFHLQVALFSRDFNCKGGTSSISNTGTFTFSREALYLPADTLNFVGVNDEKKHPVN